MFSTGEYKDRDGSNKKSWTKAGAVFQDDETGKLSIKFEAMPVGEWSGWMRIFTKEKNRPLHQHEVLTKSKDVVLDDIDDEPIDLSKIPF